MRIRVSRLVRKGDIIKFGISRPDGAGQALGEGIVRWTKENICTEHGKEAGVEFLDMQSFDIDKLIGAA
jgi:hypothetical protein